MQITRAGEYGILGALYLAKQPSHRLVMIEEISTAENIPRSFLAKIVQSLAHAGIVESQRGVGGGFRLARAPERITILQVLEAIEGTLSLQSCTENPALCVWDTSKMESCTLCALFTEAQSRVKDLFSKTTLADLSRPKAAVLQSLTGRSQCCKEAQPSEAPATK
ncbi:MAG: Rrf2 family transcriptional regulator [Verrucomicrobia bacterium]|nr:Rrf2 family transcriptional regulator [Verrucomicrobiota bacterium]